MHHFFHLNTQFLFLKQNIAGKYKSNHKCSHAIHNRSNRIYRRVQDASRPISEKADRTIQQFVQVYIQIVEPRPDLTVIREQLLQKALCLGNKRLYCFSERKHRLRQFRNDHKHYKHDNTDQNRDRKHETQRTGKPFCQLFFFHPFISKQLFFKKAHRHIQYKGNSPSDQEWHYNTERKTDPLKQQFIIPKGYEKNDRKHDQFSHFFHVFFI